MRSHPRSFSATSGLRFHECACHVITVVIPLAVLCLVGLASDSSAVPLFGPPIIYDSRPKSLDFPTSFGVADLNGDGKVDVVITDTVGGEAVDVFLGHGDGTFGPVTGYPAGLYPDVPAVADFNRDGRPDVVTYSEDEPGQINVLLGNGDGTLGPPFGFPTGQIGSVFHSLAVGDLNRDGKMDVVAADRDYGGGIGSVEQR